MSISLKVKQLGLLKSIQGKILNEDDSLILFKTRWGIHTFGLRKPIDVIILDNDFAVRKLKMNLKPLRLFFWNPQYNIVIELPSGEIKRKNIRLGETITIN